MHQMKSQFYYKLIREKFVLFLHFSSFSVTYNNNNDFNIRETRNSTMKNIVCGKYFLLQKILFTGLGGMVEIGQGSLSLQM